MLFLFKTILSGLIIATVSTLSKRYPGLGGLVASLPLVSVLGMVWLWLEKPDVECMARHVECTIWFVLPSMPMFVAIPWMMRSGVSFWLSLLVGCVLTVALYSGMIWLAPRIGLKL